MDVVNLIVALIAMCAALAAAYFAFGSPSKEDLKRVEHNTAETAQQINVVRGHISEVENHLGIQNNRVALAEAGENVRITVNGEVWCSDPLTVSFTFTDASFTLSRIELLNEYGLSSGGFDCVQTEPLTFAAVIESKAFNTWFHSGQVQSTTNRHIVSIRAMMDLATGKTQRIFPLIMETAPRGRDMAGLHYYATLTGQC